MSQSLNTKQPRSIPNSHAAVWDMVLADDLPRNLGDSIAALLIADIKELMRQLEKRGLVGRLTRMVREGGK